MSAEMQSSIVGMILPDATTRPATAEISLLMVDTAPVGSTQSSPDPALG